MSARRRDVAAFLFLAAGAFALAFAQRPGLATADTKINLHVDPGRFLADVASMWTSTGQLGAVQAGQQTGYLFPMGPFFALGHAVGLSDWVVERLWVGTLLTLAGWGVMRLLRALLDRPGPVAQLTGAAVLLLNPFVVTYINRTTGETLLAYVVLPWLLLAVHRGLRDPGRWRWAAAFALPVVGRGRDAFPASMLGRYGSEPISLAIYGGVNALAALSLLVMSADIRRLRLTDHDVLATDGEARSRRGWLNVVVFLLCIPAGYVLGSKGPYVLLLLALPDVVNRIQRLARHHRIAPLI